MDKSTSRAKERIAKVVTMRPVCVLAVLVALTGGQQPEPGAHWMTGAVARRAASLPPRDPDAEVIGPITDPRPALDGNFQVPHGHRLAGVYRNDKPRLPDDYVRYLRRQGLSAEQIEHGAGLEGTRRARAPTPVQMPLPDGLTVHLEPEQPAQPTGRPAPLPSAPAPAIEHLRAAGDEHSNEVGVAPLVPAWTGLPRLEDLRRHHRRVKQRLDEQWRQQLRQHQQLLGRRSPGAPRVQEEYHARHLPGGGRSVSYSKRTTHHTSYTSGGPAQRLRRRKRQHRPLRAGRW
ncbi:hypothetical protein FJT64_012561 [Amphibalanus amphitrite]|uniref:Uncharacterized protein n=1 Tax=Amphibalanus amphitrite TaxID=1232801 RepID=A0A6A4VCW7_AMPAM|nr:hypothetical protein FJT64_012561 [Amphibalanus amphitrite]